MATRRNPGANGRGTVGLLTVAVGILYWLSEQRRVAVFVVLAIFIPYLAFIAPLKCGGYRARDGMPCGSVGIGLLIGCPGHRFDRVRRVFRPASAAGEPTRLRTFDLVALTVAALAPVAGWLALVIHVGPR